MGKALWDSIYKNGSGYRRLACILIMAVMIVPAMALTACSSREDADQEGAAPDTSRYLVVVEDEPDTVDFQCTSIYYTIATNVFDRLVETVSDRDGKAVIEPSLARSWDISDDRCSYTFHLRDDVKFSNGEPLTSDDVLYSFKRLLTHPDSCNQDIVDGIKGAAELMNGDTDELDGFEVLGEHDFTITLDQPFEAFLACLSMPGASIMDEVSAAEAGDRFGKTPEFTIGTGPFVLTDWVPGEGMLLRANGDCWSGAPGTEGLDFRFMTEPEEVRAMFEDGELDILDTDDVDSSAEFFLHGDVYQDKLFETPRIAITYFALNESVAPLDDVRVRKALQMSLDRQVLLDAVYSGRGQLENGIFPHGLHGFNKELPEIPYDPDEAGRLLAEAGYPDGFDLTISVRDSSTQWESDLVRMAASMWKEIGVNAEIAAMSEEEFMQLRKTGKLECYSATWTADYNDPDNFINTFYGSRANTTFRSLCYPDEMIMKRVRGARTIPQEQTRIHEYQKLEKKIVQDDAAWVPLFSRLHIYVISDRVGGIQAAWNGSVKNYYRYVYFKEE